MKKIWNWIKRWLPWITEKGCKSYLESKGYKVYKVGNK